MRISAPVVQASTLALFTLDEVQMEGFRTVGEQVIDLLRRVAR